MPFQPGQVVGTPEALQKLAPERVLEILARHLSGDWGELSEADKEENNLSVREGFRILSAYWIDEADQSKGKVWVITEADRSSTCILEPDQY
ncbi:MAG: hypothetical protein ABSF90_21220 [Syntrophobacteraceae bacterium]|jgi:hypothetical protein